MLTLHETWKTLSTDGLVWKELLCDKNSQKDNRMKSSIDDGGPGCSLVKVEDKEKYAVAA